MVVLSYGLYYFIFIISFSLNLQVYLFQSICKELKTHLQNVQCSIYRFRIQPR